MSRPSRQGRLEANDVAEANSANDTASRAVSWAIAAVRSGVDAALVRTSLSILLSVLLTRFLVIQEEKESVVRINGIDPKTKVAYQPLNQAMQYPA